MKLAHELGNDVNAVNSMGIAAIHGAANRGADDVIEYLAANGARLDVADAQGRTPLDWAAGVFLATHPPVRKPDDDRAARTPAARARRRGDRGNDYDRDAADAAMRAHR